MHRKRFVQGDPGPGHAAPAAGGHAIPSPRESRRYARARNLRAVSTHLRLSIVRSHHVDFKRDLITVRQSDWKEQITAPKSGKARRVPMTSTLAAALNAIRHRARTEGALPARRERGLRQLAAKLDAASASPRWTSGDERVCTSCGTRSGRISRCAARRSERFRSWPDTPT